jgi:Sigma-70, region 4
MPPVEKIDAAAAEMLGLFESWAAARRTHALGRAEQLILTWVRKRLPNLRATYSDFRSFVITETHAHQNWGLMNFIAQWFVRHEPAVFNDLMSLQMVVLMKAIEDQEREERPLAMAVIKRARALKAAARALRTEIERQAQSDRRGQFWTRFANRLSATASEILGTDIAGEIAASMKKRLDANPRTPLETALSPLRKRWDELLTEMATVLDETLAAIQGSFMSETVVSSHAPPKRGARRRVVELSRIGLSHKEIAAFEGITPKAVSDHLRRARKMRAGSAKGS